jgi:hypothetical protein
MKEGVSRWPRLWQSLQVLIETHLSARHPVRQLLKGCWSDNVA